MVVVHLHVRTFVSLFTWFSVENIWYSYSNLQQYADFSAIQDHQDCHIFKVWIPCFRIIKTDTFWLLDFSLKSFTFSLIEAQSRKGIFWFWMIAIDWSDAVQEDSFCEELEYCFFILLIYFLKREQTRHGLLTPSV